MPNAFAGDSCVVFEVFEGLTLHCVRSATVTSPVVRSTCGIDGSTGQKRLSDLFRPEPIWRVWLEPICIGGGSGNLNSGGEWI